MRVYQGLRPDFAKLAELGAAGCVPVPANLRPEQYAEAWSQRDEPVAQPRLQASCDALWSELVLSTDFFSRTLKRLAEEGLGTGVMPEPF